MTEAAASWLTADPSGVTISVVVQPRGGKNAVVGVHGEALKLRIGAAPVDGAANAAMTRFLAETLRVPASAVTVRSGHSSRRNRVRVEGVAANEVLARLCGKD